MEGLELFFARKCVAKCKWALSGVSLAAAAAQVYAPLVMEIFPTHHSSSSRAAAAAAATPKHCTPHWSMAATTAQHCTTIASHGRCVDGAQCSPCTLTLAPHPQAPSPHTGHLPPSCTYVRPTEGRVVAKCKRGDRRDGRRCCWCCCCASLTVWDSCKHVRCVLFASSSVFSRPLATPTSNHGARREPLQEESSAVSPPCDVLPIPLCFASCARPRAGAAPFAWRDARLCSRARLPASLLPHPPCQSLVCSLVCLPLRCAFCFAVCAGSGKRNALAVSNASAGRCAPSERCALKGTCEFRPSPFTNGRRTPLP